ncbi:MAG: hypothetical protein ACYDHZ_07095 [Dehalococcoidia bacterium]|jgi:hypothetical protein
MEQEFQPGVEDSAVCPPDQEDPIEALLSALNDLKSNISRVEENHPRLRKDMSELCDLVISHVSRPLQEQIATVLESPALAACEETAEPEEPPADDPLISRYLEYLHRSHSPGYEPPDNPPPSPSTPIQPSTVNPFSKAVDSSGNHLVRALDKMGDGIIYAMEKLLSLGYRKPRS